MSGVTLDRASLVAEVDAALTLAGVEAALGKEALTLDLGDGADPALTVAQWLAAGAPGARDPFRDPADHLVAGLVALLPGGRVLRVRPGPRRAVGPDLVALFVGMGERFGRITRAHLRVHVKDGELVRRPEAPRFARETPAGPNDGERALLDAIARELGGGQEI